MGLLHYIKGAVSNVHVPGEKPDIFIFAAPGSGSTLVLEIIAAQPRMKVYDEPTNIDRPAVQRALGIRSWKDFVTLPNRKERYLNYFSRLCRNELKELNPVIYGRHGRFITERHVFTVPFVGNDLIGWFAETFEAMVVVLIRHPVLTALSRGDVTKRLPHYLKHPDLRGFFDTEEIAFAESIIKQGNGFEKNILDWCLQMAPIQRKPLDPACALISYEDLMVHPAESLAYLKEKLALAPVDDVARLWNDCLRSLITVDDERRRFLENGHAEGRLTSEKKGFARLTPRNLARAFEICSRFRVDLYEIGSYFPAPAYRLPTLPRPTEKQECDAKRLAS